MTKRANNSNSFRLRLARDEQSNNRIQLKNTFMLRTRQYIRSLGLASLLYALVVPSSVHAASLTVTPMTTSNGGLFHYDYTISNDTTTDFSLVTIEVAARPDAVQNLVIPNGFLSSFDASLGLLDFGGADSPGFTAGATFSGFAFDSPLQPEASSFTALRLDANENPVTLTGQTLAPTAVPEPSSLVGLALVPSLLLFRRKRPNGQGKPAAVRAYQHHS